MCVCVCVRCLFGFDDISTFVGYLMPNLFLYGQVRVRPPTRIYLQQLCTDTGCSL